MNTYLGGFLGRKGDGDPGTQTLWIGLQRLDDIVATWSAIMASLTETHRTVLSKRGSG